MIKSNQSEAGFTLIEMGMVLFIIMIITAIAVPAMSGLAAQERLRGEAQNLRESATGARRQAVEGGVPCAIVFGKNGYEIESLGKNESEVLAERGLAAKLLVKRWDSDKYQSPEGVRWVFQPDGICEPMRARFENKDGWVEIVFNPLTAAVDDESYQFR